MSDPDLGADYDKILQDLKSFGERNYKRNKYLDTIKAQRNQAQLIIQKKELELMHEIRQLNLRLNELREKYNLFEYYDSD